MVILGFERWKGDCYTSVQRFCWTIKEEEWGCVVQRLSSWFLHCRPYRDTEEWLPRPSQVWCHQKSVHWEWIQWEMAGISKLHCDGKWDRRKDTLCRGWNGWHLAHLSADLTASYLEPPLQHHTRSITSTGPRARPPAWCARLSPERRGSRPSAHAFCAPEEP